MKQINGIIMQYFEWYLNCNGQLWNQIIKEAEKLSKIKYNYNEGDEVI